MKKSLLSFLLSGTLLLAASVPALAAGDTVVLHPDDTTATINGANVTIESPPYIQQGTTMVPLRFLCENILKAQINWDNINKEVSILGQDLVVEINTTTGAITSNGEAYQSAVAPALKAGYTYVPLRLLSELFGCEVKYTAPPATITVTLADDQPKEEILPPVAMVDLPESYTKGGPFTTEDGSYDPAGRGITATRWQIGGELVTDLKTALNKQPAGQVEVSYQVMNDGNVWSEPWVGTILVIDNQPPKITSLTNSTATPNIGQQLSLTYAATNEDWESIVAYNWSWTYNGTTYQGKPRAFFAAGDYTVNLSATDAYGLTSETYQLPITVSNNVTTTEKQFKFSQVIPGELFLNTSGFNHNTLPDAKYSVRNIGSTTLIASNNPETVTEYGILYHGHASGNVRVRYHHVNGTSSPMYIKALAYNPGTEAVNIQIRKRALAGPNNSAIFTGMKVVDKFLTNDVLLETITVPAGATVTLNADLGSLKPQDVAAGLIEGETSGPLEFFITSGASSTQAFQWQNLSYASLVKTHVRGTFQQVDTAIDVLASGSAEKIVLGRADTPGGFATGTDEVLGTAAINYGNRGVLVTLKITAGDEDTALWFNPRGTSYYGVILWDKTPIYLSNSGMFKGSAHGAVLGVLKAGQTVNLTYLTPSGTDSDALIILSPKSEWKSEY